MTRAAPLALSLLLAAATGDAQSRMQVLRDTVNAGAVRHVPRADGSALVLGSSGGGSVSWLAELSPAGDIARQVTFTGPTANPTLRALHETPDGGVVLAGSMATSGASNPLDAVVLRLDAAWNVEWQVCHGIPNGNEVVYGLQATSDGGWLVHGNGSGGGMMLRLDASGAVSWERLYSATGWLLSFFPMSPLGPDRWLLASRTQGANSTLDQVLLVEVRADGSVVSPRLLDTPNQDSVTDVCALPDGSAWVVGRMNDASGTVAHAAVQRLAADGSLVWSRGFRLSAATLNTSAATPDPLGGLVVASTFGTPREGNNVALFHVDETGASTWSSILGGTLDEGVGDLVFGRDGLVLAGGTASLDGAGAPRRAWIAQLDDAHRVPPDCGFDRADTLAETDLAPTPGLIDVVARDATGAVTVDAPITVAPASLTSHVACTGAAPPPTEVSPAGASTPLLVRDGGVLTWEDGAFSRSDAFDVHRGPVSALRARDYGACWQAALVATTVADGELPGPGNAWFYLVAGRNAAGLGPLGWDSLGQPEVPPARCP